jgi:alpha-tubulin suppressor-like RCC1 family protein
MKVPVSAFATGLLLLTLGCREDAQSPSDNEPARAVAGTPLTFRLVTTAGQHSCGVTTDSRAYCWGSNSHGELGDGTTTIRTRPVAVAGGLRFASVSAGDAFTCGVTTGQKGYCWGWNDAGQLGDGTTTNRLRPVAVKGGLLFRQIRPGSHFTCGATTSDKGYCWGSNENGKLGIGVFGGRRLVPSLVIGSILFQRVIAGGSHACGLTRSARALCWGGGNVGQIGDGKIVLGRASPRLVAGGLTFTHLATGEAHTCAVTTGKLAYCWGDNELGALGDGTITNRSVPTRVAGGDHYKALSTLSHHTCGITSLDEVQCWGNNIFGQVGNNRLSAFRFPTEVTGGLRFSSLSGGIAAYHTCGIVLSGATYCWGGNNSGQLGDGTRTNHSTPAPISSPS